jgi:hypothetical protein
VKKGQTEKIIAQVVIISIPFASALINIGFTHFAVGIVSISLLSFWLLKKIGDFIQKKLTEPALLGVTVKFVVWLFGFFGYFFILLIFLTYFMIVNPRNQISRALISGPDVVNKFAYIIICFLFALFIIRFLLTYIKTSNIETFDSSEVINLLAKTFIIIIFSDVAYAVVYFAFSGIYDLQGKTIISLYIKGAPYFIQTFYYAFCIHFSIPISSLDGVQKLDTLIRGSTNLQIVQFFHICLNKIVDITMLGYMASIFMDKINVKKKKVGKLKQIIRTPRSLK